jgi:glycosyltransferase involved in cell wall biosynthesis
LEGIPVSLMEAISFGIPVAGCNICGVPEIVNDRTGILLEKNFNINHSSALIHRFLIQECSTATFRTGVKDFWKRNFNADRNYPDFINKQLLN